MSQLIQSLEQRGFDRCAEDGYLDVETGKFSVSVSCSQCEALVINGVACHEHGCPNETHECWECETPIPKKYRLCESCANPDLYDR